MSAPNPVATTTLVRRVYLAAPAEAVWPWLVEPERVRLYALCDLEARPTAPGVPIRYLNRLAGTPVIEGVVEEIIEGRRLAHSFQFQFDPPDPPCRVRYEILRCGDEMCCLEVRHEGLVPGTETCESVATSLEVTLSSLKTLLETGRPLPWPARHRPVR
jgi:uncharacterized protein YndB with AHSA1/START domain